MKEIHYAKEPTETDSLMPKQEETPNDRGMTPAEGTRIPAELTSLHEVDMDSPDLDPLEWAVRRVIPIPKQYFWENEQVSPEDLPSRLKMWHRTVGGMSSALQFVENWVGKPLVNASGITSSQFGYVTSTMNEKDWEFSRNSVLERLKKDADFSMGKDSSIIPEETDGENNVELPAI